MTSMERLDLSETEWRKRLTPEQYHVLREAGTERAFSGRYDNNKADGVYRCAACGLDLFDSAEEQLRLGHKQRGRAERIAAKQAQLRATLGENASPEEVWQAMEQLVREGQRFRLDFAVFDRKECRAGQSGQQSGRRGQKTRFPRRYSRQ